jgi:hypothetical protein
VHKTKASQKHEQKSQEHKQSKTNAQRWHQKIFVETYQTDHNILSFDAEEDRQQTPGGYRSDYNIICLFFFVNI